MFGLTLFSFTNNFIEFVRAIRRKSFLDYCPQLLCENTCFRLISHNIFYALFIITAQKVAKLYTLEYIRHLNYCSKKSPIQLHHYLNQMSLVIPLY